MSFLKVDTESVLRSSESDYSIGISEPDIPILSDTEYKAKAIHSFSKCINSKQKSEPVPTYYSYSSRITTKPKGFSKFPPSYMLASFFMTSFNLNMTTAFKAIKTFNPFDKRALDRTIVYREGHIDITKIPANIRHVFNNTTVINDKYSKVDACIIIEDDLLKEMNRFIKVVNNLAPQQYAGVKSLPIYKPLITLSTNDFLSMSPTSRIRILSQTIKVKRNKLQVAINVKRDIGNLGREYHILTNIPRTDRAKITNLYGYDFESALQTILLAILQEVNPSLPLTVTQNYVKNKNAVRQYVVDTLGVDKEKAKKIITAAYQGGSIGGIPKIIGSKISTIQRKGMKGLYDETVVIMKELLKVSAKSYTAPLSTLGSHFKAARWYASKRTSIKWELTQDFTYEYYNKFIEQYGLAKASKYKKSYMFYFWTYFEGEARKILQNHLKQDITLHDAVYTQDEPSFKAMVVSDVEDEIYNKIGINLKLGKA